MPFKPFACFSWDPPGRRRTWNELPCDLTTYGCGLQWCTTFFCFCINFTDTTASHLQRTLKSPSSSRVFHRRSACAAVCNVLSWILASTQTAAQRRGVEHTRPRAGNASGPAAAIVFRVLHCACGGSLHVASRPFNVFYNAAAPVRVHVYARTALARTTLDHDRQLFFYYNFIIRHATAAAAIQ